MYIKVCVYIHMCIPIYIYIGIYIYIYIYMHVCILYIIYIYTNTYTSIYTYILSKAKPEERMPITECSQHPWLTSMKQDLSESINSKEVHYTYV